MKGRVCSSFQSQCIGSLSVKSSLASWSIINHCLLFLVRGQSVSFNEHFLSSYYLHRLGVQRWIRLLLKGFWPRADRPLALEDVAWHEYILGIQHVCMALGWHTFSFLTSLVLAFFMHKRKQHFVHTSAFNRLIAFDRIIPRLPAMFIWVILCASRLACSKEVGQLYCPNWTEGNWLVLDEDCLGWLFCSRKTQREHLSTYDCLLIRKWCHWDQVWESGRERTTWSNKRGRPLNLWCSGQLEGNIGE